MRYFGSMEVYDCIICHTMMDAASFSPSVRAGGGMDRRCLNCEAYECPEAICMLDPIAPLLHIIGPKALMTADLSEVVPNLMVVTAFRSASRQITFSGAPTQQRLADELKAMMELPLNIGLVAATPEQWAVALVPLSGASAGEAFILRFYLDPTDYPKTPPIIKLEPSLPGKSLSHVGWWEEGVMLADLCVLVEKELSGQGLAGGLMSAFSHMPIVKETLIAVRHVIRSTVLMGQCVVRYMAVAKQA